ncbi:MAG: hypothetical protein HY261_04485 [Chloroflexi bacterium]|nr:hypothetical protein [Chloroflexota bacterium]
MADELNAATEVKRTADGVQRLADQLHETLVALAANLVPFPYFLGSTEVRAIEAEPGGVERADRGCIVVCDDGEMYEFIMKVQQGDLFDGGMGRDDSVKKVEMRPEDYIPYAYHAIKEIGALIDEQKTRAKKYSW